MDFRARPKMENPILQVSGFTLLGLSAGMVPCLIANLFSKDSIFEFLPLIIIGAVIGTIILLFSELPRSIKPVDGLLMITVVWIVAIIFGAFPFLIAGMDPIDAVFESTSGITTTGATILTDYNAYSSGIILWRSMTQWLGGIVIIIIFMFLLPMLGFGGRELFGGQMSGSGGKNFSMKMRDAAKEFVWTYVLLTAAMVIILLLLGVNIYESLSMTFSSVSTGGFMCKADSTIGYSSAVKIVVTLFMFLGGTNFFLHYKAIYQRKFKSYLHNEEFRFMIFWTIGAIALIFLLNYGSTLLNPDFTGDDVVDLVYNVVSATTTTGSVASDYGLWAPAAVFLMFAVMFVGGSTGSTTGGIKIGRLMILFRYILNGIRTMLHPKAVYDVRFNEGHIDNSTVSSAVSLAILFFVTMMVATLIIMAAGVEPLEALTTSIGCLTTFGPAIGTFGPLGSYASMEWYIKLFLAFLMWLGRLEIITGLIMFTPGYWKEFKMSRRKRLGNMVTVMNRRFH